ncbi:hypothetical protein [Corynebacterium aquilae]|uniref:Uncharacterized protein n=1 Tax=Corynebacterium aquilae DSM 44791 TaxID=1431546 RepID=A0A1L7CFL3_9CORY|nr:hypothetical protein [Corynebacterium aquilae]APT84616.1 hypothetical protein CAQU_05520 [Corynebacterium aquilae DSM 44791]
MSTTIRLNSTYTLHLEPNRLVSPDIQLYAQQYWANTGANQYGSLDFTYLVNDITRPTSSPYGGLQPAHLAAVGARAQLNPGVCAECLRPLVLTNRTRLSEAIRGKQVICRYCDPHFSAIVSNAYNTHANPTHPLFAEAHQALTNRARDLTQTHTAQPLDGQAAHIATHLAASAATNHTFDMFAFIGASSTRTQLLALGYLQEQRLGMRPPAAIFGLDNHIEFTGQALTELIHTGWIYPISTPSISYAQLSTPAEAIHQGHPSPYQWVLRGSTLDAFLPSAATTGHTEAIITRALHIAARFRLTRNRYSPQHPTKTVQNYGSQLAQDLATHWSKTVWDKDPAPETTPPSATANSPQAHDLDLDLDLDEVKTLIEQLFVADLRTHLHHALHAAGAYPVDKDQLDAIATALMRHNRHHPYGHIMFTVAAIARGYVEQIREQLLRTHDTNTALTDTTAEIAQDISDNIRWVDTPRYVVPLWPAISIKESRWADIANSCAGHLQTILGWQPKSFESLAHSLSEFDAATGPDPHWAQPNSPTGARPRSPLTHACLDISDLFKALAFGLQIPPSPECTDPDNPLINPSAYFLPVVELLGIPDIISQSCDEMISYVDSPADHPATVELDAAIASEVGRANQPLLGLAHQGDPVAYAQRFGHTPTAITALNNEDWMTDCPHTDPDWNKDDTDPFEVLIMTPPSFDDE